MQSMHLNLDQVVDVRQEGTRIVIEPLQEKTYELTDLLKGINAKNRHASVEFWPPQGEEVW